jgi:hypothetical protein
MGTDASDTESRAAQEAVPGKAGRPPPIVLTSATKPYPLVETTERHG